MENDLFFFELPKIEVHAHLNGSISNRTLKTLLEKHSAEKKIQQLTMIDKEIKTMEECFKVFKMIHELVTSTEEISLITKNVIEDFAKDNIKYLELRTTPRNDLGNHSTKKTYVDAVLKGIQEYNYESDQPIDVRILLSLDRRQKWEEAQDTVTVAREYAVSSNDIVLGIDLSGDPFTPVDSEYYRILRYAKASGLKLALHVGEVEGQDEESGKLLQILPDRIGHGTFLYDNENLKGLIMKNRIPLEICLSSNVITRTARNYDEHHIHKWIDLNHPVLISTDDKGVFGTSLSNEYKIAADALRIQQRAVYDLSKQSIDHIFADDNTKWRLHQDWALWLRNLDLNP